ncbi:MAG: hypothetical protein LBC02_06570 [Planctomycetaceae bacterium]|jgi:hypothetical protein|nr:hypothetical protein [Planctomycetaceae bacterium]
MYLLFLISLLCCFIGCTSTPTEFGNLTPTTIVVINGDKPVEGVLVMLYSKTSHSLRGCSAVTDISGVAKISTTIRTKIALGAAPGDYVVVLSKNAALPNELIPTENEQTFSEKIRVDLQVKREVFLEKNRIIPKILGDSATSPIELTVTEKNSTKLTIDVAKYF